MGDYFNIPEEDRNFTIGVFDDMLTEFGKPCKLRYVSTETTCPNCIINPRTGESMNIYKPGGPVEFEEGEICPVCEGRGRIAGTETSDIITMTIDWTPKPWMDLGPTSGSKTSEGDRVVRVPSGMITTRGWTKDLPKVVRAENAIMDITNQYISNLYKLYGQPYILGAITNNRYFIAIWERSG